jgi:alkaline phosphatase D
VGLAAPALLDLSACDDDPGAAPIALGELFFPQGIASGDPRPDSVVLWARVADPSDAGELDVTLVLGTTLSLSRPLATLSLVARPDDDHVVKVKVSGLDPGATYYYRFVYERADGRLGSRLGRTRTAPAPDADAEVKMALASCQDFIGRQYNAYAKMYEIADNLDVVVHVGDYVYETTGDPSFQSGGEGTRKVVFSDTAGAIAFKDAAGEVTHYAAQSLSNYRELYKTYRSDLWLQLVHERVPFVFVWDDHEFSDDCWQDHATYFDGKQDEHQTERRKNAERANFEFLPTELGLSADGASLAIGGRTPIADSGTVIYRDFRFGKHVHLILTDSRTYRPDHAIPEDAYPARVILTADELADNGLDPAATKDAGGFVYPPYVDLDQAALAAYRPPLVEALVTVYAEALPDAAAADVRARAERQAVGRWSAVELNRLLEAAIASGAVAAFDVGDTTELPRGATFDHLRFSAGNLFARDGVNARYLVEQRHYEAYQKTRYRKDAGAQSLFGATQEAWLRQTLTSSTATWKVVACQISMTPMILDARTVPPALEGREDTALVASGLGLLARLLSTPYLSVDQWDGFPDKRQEMLDLMRGIPNCVLLAGDIHSFYATNHGRGDGPHGVVELTGGGISSESFKGFVRSVVDAVVPGVSQVPNVAAIISHLEELLQFTFPGLTWANNDAHGFFAATFAAAKAYATAFVAPIEHVVVDAAGDLEVATAPYTGVSFGIEGGVLTKSG